MTLSEFIDQQLACGVSDPHEIARAACCRQEWIVGELHDQLVSVVATIARKQIGYDRNRVMPGAVRYARGGIDIPALVFVPSKDLWMPAEDLTAEDCEYVAAGYRQREAENRVWAERFEGWAVLLRVRGGTLGDLLSEQEAA